MAEKKGNGKRKEISVRVSLPDDDRVEKVALAAYAFSQGGTLLDSQPVKGGRAKVGVPLGIEGTSVRVLVGPTLDEDAQTLAELARRRATERHLRVELDSGQLGVDIAIGLDDLVCWLLGRCAVRGTVLKRTTIDARSIDLPVCDATVEVYEVDPWPVIVGRLSPDVLDRLRDIVLRPIPLPEPIPDPLPGPFPGPFPPGPGPDPVPFRTAAGAAIPRRFAADEDRVLSLAETDVDTAQLTRTRVDAAAALERMPSASELRFAARTASDLEFRRVLADYPLLLRPILCLFYPYLVTMQQVATAETDDCGHFRTSFFRGCNDTDTPDLYFKVKQRFLGLFTITIHAPTPVACHTWWNYECGSEVTIVTHHPLARTCAPCAPVDAGDNWVLFTAIGQTSMNAIHGNSDALQGSTTPANRGLTKSGAPFGGVLRPQLLFDSSLREHLGVKYYRLSWRRAGTSGWVQMLEDVGRHYTYETGGELVSQLYKLGPLSPPDAPAANLYEIPPALPPEGTWGPVIAPTDYQNGVFDTRLPAPGIGYSEAGAEIGTDQSGKFEIRLELFDSGGNPVDIGAAGIRYFVPDLDNLNGTITTVDAATLGLVSGNAMIVTVHVDNNPTFAEIDPPTVGAASADPCCGVLGFDSGDTVTLPWRAKHKNGFATFTFRTKRVDELVFLTGSTPVGPTGSHSTTQTAQSLMDANLPPGCAPGGCNVAAFASFEYVTATATDGWSRLHYLDSSDFEAFTLSRTSS